MAADVSRDYLDRAHALLKEAEEACTRYDWALCVLRSADCVEFSLKAIVQLITGSHKREHDVSGELINLSDKYPNWFKVKLPRIGLMSRILNSLSIPAKYGDEMLHASPKNIFEQLEAEALMGIAKQVCYDCDRLFYEIKYRRS